MNPHKFKHFYLNKYCITPISSKRYRLCYNYQYKVLWFRVAKAANTTINQLFIENSPVNKHIHTKEVAYFSSTFSKYLKFAFVRNPIDRFVSTWKNKVRDKNYFLFSEEIYLEMKNIEYFISWVEKLDLERCDQHLRLQTSLIDLKHIDFIGRVENFENDFRQLAQLIKMPVSEIPRLNKTVNSQESLSPFHEQRIRKLYQKDFHVFYPNY